MKNFFVIIAVLLTVYACNESTTNNKETNQVKALINGNQFQTDKINVEVMLGPARKQLRIYGESGQLALELILKFEPIDSIKAGTYYLSKDGDFLGVYYHTDVKDTATEGTVVLENFIDGQNPIAKGTFNFLVKQNNTLQYSVTNGVFNSGK
jgi:hypothetical protein